MAQQFQDPILADTVLNRPLMQSDNYVAGVSGWALFQNGDAEFNGGTFRGLITGDSGFLLYSGTPALGNLIASDTPGPGTDSLGNAYLGGRSAYTVHAGTYYAHQMGNNGGAGPQLDIYYTATAPGGPWSSSITATIDAQGIIWSTPAGGIFEIAGAALRATGGTAANPTLITTDSWTNVTPPVNFTGTLRYKLMENDSVRIQFQLAVAAGQAAGTVNLFTLAAPYIPVTDFRGAAPGYFGTLGSTRFHVTTLGAVQFLGFNGGANISEIDGCYDVPLD